MRSRPAVRALAGAFAFVVAGCAGVRSYQIVPAPFSARVELQSSELTVDQEAWLAELCPFGAPRLGEYYDREPLTLLVREGYAIMHSDRTKTPIWVCERVRHEDVHGPLTGRDDWAPDPVLCTLRVRCERGAVDSDYRRSGYDRGHLAPNWNQRQDPQRKRETFYFSNAAPQVGRSFNQSTWQALERELTTWTETLQDFWTITGVLFYDEKEEDPDTADGFIQVETIGAGSVFVPTHFYKIVVWREDDELNAFAVVMENRAYQSHESFRDASHLRSIRWLEERLAVDFMPELEPVDADDLEIRIGSPFR
jgi:endonuclease G, mitochondrial